MQQVNRVLIMKWTLVFLFVFLQCLLLTKCAVQYNYGTPPESILEADGDTRISGIQDRKNKDIILGGLLIAHPHDPASGGGKCG